MLRSRPVLLLALAATVFGSGLLLAACGDGDDATTTESTTTTSTQTTSDTTTQTTTTVEAAEPVVVRVVVADGVPRGGIVRQKVSQGARVELVVRSNVADEVHVHGYDISREVAPGVPARVAFVAKLPGRFEVELEESGVQIADLTVEP